MWFGLNALTNHGDRALVEANGDVVTIEVDPDQLRDAVESQHGGKAIFLQAVPVRDEFEGQTAWEGVVHIFNLHRHPTADRAYAWSTVIDEATQRRRFYAVLHAGPVKSPADAVRAAIVAEHRQK